MGGAVSAGVDNDELIDNLLEADYIKTAVVERVFRAVDRGHYFTIEYKERAYRDIAWKCGNLHISAPCIYSKVMENLKLAPGLSFLNLGSGTGYLSTMAGLILGPYGINHGIEIHEDVLNYATKKLDEFVSTSSAIDEYEFCQPKFVSGNCLNLGGGARQYDRVYCSAACPEHHESYMKNLIKVGGILVIPINDQLLQICRTSDTNWESKSVLPVSFATLVSGKISDCQEPLKMPDADPLSLQDICCFMVRSILRQIIDIEHPELKRLPRITRKKVKKRPLRQLVIPLFHSNSEDEEEITTVQTSRSIIGWSQILRGPSASVGTIETRVSSENNSHNSSTSANQVEDDNIMEEDSNSESGTLSNNFFEEMSGEELLSDFEELHNILAMSGTTSTVTSGSDSEGGRQNLSPETGGDNNEKNKTKGKHKLKKIDSSMLKDFETNWKEWEEGSDSDRDENLEVSEPKCSGASGDQYPFVKVTESDTDTESCENTLKEKIERKKPEANPATDSSSEVNYTTYMKEKIKMLPLPMTLKYFLNLNRDL